MTERETAREMSYVSIKSRKAHYWPVLEAEMR